MTLELPPLRLGLAGFTSEQTGQVASLLKVLTPVGVTWEIAPFSEADAWWLCGARTQLLQDGTVRVAPGVPSGRALQLALSEVDRPVAFSQPLAAAELEPSYTFDLDQVATVAPVLRKFTAWMQPVVCQFSLASAILAHASVLGQGNFDVLSDGELIAVVDLRGAIGILPTAAPLQFDDALWQRRPAATAIPANFLRTDLSQIMWQYALRTRRDVLPAHYRKGPVFFRRPPRLPQRMMRDADLLLLRELATAPGSFDDLQQRTGMREDTLARHLAALYLVGSVTSNPKRAAAGGLRTRDSLDSGGQQTSVLPSSFESAPVPATVERRTPPAASDLTAPAPLWPR